MNEKVRSARVWRAVLWFFKLVACARQGLKIVMPEHKFILANPPSLSHPSLGTDAHSIPTRLSERGWLGKYKVSFVSHLSF